MCRIFGKASEEGLRPVQVEGKKINAEKSRKALREARIAAEKDAKIEVSAHSVCRILVCMIHIFQLVNFVLLSSDTRDEGDGF